MAVAASRADAIPGAGLQLADSNALLAFVRRAAQADVPISEIDPDEKQAALGRLTAAVEELSIGAADAHRALSSLVAFADQVAQTALPTAIRARLTVLVSELLRAEQRLSDGAAVVSDLVRFFADPWAVRDAELVSVRSELSKRLALFAAEKQRRESCQAELDVVVARRARAAWARMAAKLLKNRRRDVAMAALRRRTTTLLEMLRSIRRRPGPMPPLLPGMEYQPPATATGTLTSADRVSFSAQSARAGTTPPPASPPPATRPASDRAPSAPSGSPSPSPSRTSSRQRYTPVAPPPSSLARPPSEPFAGQHARAFLGMREVVLGPADALPGESGVPPLFPTDLMPPGRTVLPRDEVAELRALHAKQLHYIARYAGGAWACIGARSGSAAARAVAVVDCLTGDAVWRPAATVTAA